MGRFSGKITTKQAQRIELSFLLKAGFIEKGQKIRRPLVWNNGHLVWIESDFTMNQKIIRLAYQIESSSGKLFEMNYPIQIESIPSNLGRGEVYYFKCPNTGIRSRILYLAYGSPIFKARESYQIRIFYQSQIISRNQYHKERFFFLEELLSRLEAKIKKSHYQGRQTRIIQRYYRLQEKSFQHDLKSLYSLFRRLDSLQSISPKTA